MVGAAGPIRGGRALRGEIERCGETYTKVELLWGQSERNVLHRGQDAGRCYISVGLKPTYLSTNLYQFTLGISDRGEPSPQQFAI